MPIHSWLTLSRAIIPLTVARHAINRLVLLSMRVRVDSSKRRPHL